LLYIFYFAVSSPYAKVALKFAGLSAYAAPARPPHKIFKPLILFLKKFYVIGETYTPKNKGKS